ncbi:protein disulfide oxidoreductase [Pseudidiomarina sediminum]|uniref:Protein disulfide oxidoreductase n=1 Tax=Pseudidiomarina sediminum TaxID=431675 RepID=A0A432ZAH4_9GAMM|nr:protein disulfide oxidoreductase [Pseudidiomarina sediminum]MBY6064168.1 protein disulfide oxidoreductase [Pseudidiomarina sediminum]RUO74956.1 protein disulfide oxidoreductase [Pseudidiomarina sediminum]
MFKKLLGFLLMVMVVVTVMDVWRGKDLPVGELPESVWMTITEQQRDIIAESYEQPVIVYFWATWCPVCSTITPSVDWLAGHLPVVTVAMRSGTDAELQRYVTQNDYQMVVVNDATGRLSQQWGVPVTPAFAIVSEGEIQSFTAGLTTPMGLYARWLWAKWL